VLSAQPRYGVSALIEHIVKDGRGPVWFFSSPLHRDLVRIDPHAQVLRRSYRWGFPSDPFLGHVRPGDVDWIEIRNPGWATGEGWHLTPETAGLAVASGTGLGSGPIAAQVRTRPGATRVLVGGRHLGRAGDPDLAFALSVGERVVDRWSVSAASPFFLRFVDLPAGTLAAPGPWMPLTVEARRTDTLAFSPLGAVEQFNLQDDSTPMAGYGAGWHENEFTPKTGVLWRWTSQRAELDIRPLTGNLHLDITGESPVRDHPRPSAVTVRAGPLTVLKQAVSGEFAWSVHVPAEALAASGGIVTIETDQVFRPADRGENADRRALGLRVFRVAVRPAS
jgi:hypothetical protein